MENDDTDSPLTGAHDTTAAARDSADKTLDLADADSNPLDADTKASESASSEPGSYVIEEIGEDPMLREAGRIVTDLIDKRLAHQDTSHGQGDVYPLDASLSR